jgi:hypothetical protein
MTVHLDEVLDKGDGKMRTLQNLRTTYYVEWPRTLAGLAGTVAANMMLAAIGSLLFA